MADVFLGSLMLVPYNFAPYGYAFCQGQILNISQYTALFSLLGTYYGGDGKSNFALPNMQGNLVVSSGQGPGLSVYDLGETGGSPTVQLLVSQLPSHSHNLQAIEFPEANNTSPINAALGSKPGVTNIYSTSTSPLVAMDSNAIAPIGGSQPHNNMMPYLTLNFCIALQGIFPPRS